MEPNADMTISGTRISVRAKDADMPERAGLKQIQLLEKKVELPNADVKGLLSKVEDSRVLTLYMNHHRSLNDDET
ncbi:hypothetical protein SARC_06727 [Sphaeroforma arctica JP610]|uniref:Uncharacterized protein n=1 Tax=Sphaeroforma arctica JP610 TaxID=667725 RepID=A0A0L0FWB0_9EUKA|nr:hypothetical protein SARC_06727 [Sphaeroforma arctica JP610]KNC80939.1 hypothetical protein SARC_06727 [Sphaeroforma arctica JP610]|eukprot:XP_014154841.1 hypothetical protein SARC_06727 [Sphaeroforma arctica JP610]